MNRRAFFSGLAGLVACAALDPERSLWRPTKTIFVPPVNGIIEAVNDGVSASWDGIVRDPCYDQINATTLEALRMNVIFTNLFRDTPIVGYVRKTLLPQVVIEHPFVYNTSLESP